MGTHVNKNLLAPILIEPSTERWQLASLAKRLLEYLVNCSTMSTYGSLAWVRVICKSMILIDLQFFQS